MQLLSKQLTQNIIHLYVHIPYIGNTSITTIHPQQRRCLLYSLGVMIGAHSSSRVVDTQAKDVMLAKEGIAQRFEHKHLRICMWGILISLQRTQNIWLKINSVYLETHYALKFEVVMPVKMLMLIFWVVTLCKLVDTNTLSLNIEAGCSSKTLACTYKSTLCYRPRKPTSTH